MAERAPSIHPAVPGAVRTRRTTSGALEHIGAVNVDKKKQPHGRRCCENKHATTLKWTLDVQWPRRTAATQLLRNR